MKNIFTLRGLTWKNPEQNGMGDEFRAEWQSSWGWMSNENCRSSFRPSSLYIYIYITMLKGFNAFACKIAADGSTIEGPSFQSDCVCEW